MSWSATVIAFLQAHGELNASGVVILIVVFVVTGLMPIPRTTLCLASGAIYGVAAAPVILPSTTLGGILGFLIARYLFAERLQAMVQQRRRWRAVLGAIDDEGWRIVGLMRFASAMPTFTQNYLFGLTRIGVVPFTVATFVFTIPQVVFYLYLGSLGRAALLDEGGSHLGLAIGAIGAVSLLAVLVIVTRKARMALRLAGAEAAAPED